MSGQVIPAPVGADGGGAERTGERKRPKGSLPSWAGEDSQATPCGSRRNRPTTAGYVRTCRYLAFAVHLKPSSTGRPEFRPLAGPPGRGAKWTGLACQGPEQHPCWDGSAPGRARTESWDELPTRGTRGPQSTLGVPAQSPGKEPADQQADASR